MEINLPEKSSRKSKRRRLSHSNLRNINKRYGRTIRPPVKRKAVNGARRARAAHSTHDTAGAGKATRRNRIILWTTVIVIALALGGLSHAVSLKTIHAWSNDINAWLLILLILVLPLIGMPMSICGIVIGAKFGVTNGLIVTAVAVAFHLSASWGIAKTWLHKPLEKILQKTRYKMPSMETGEYAGVCLLTALIPGPSYTLKNYFLGLSNLPFGIILGVGLPANIFAMSPGILFGSFSGTMNWQKAAFLIAYAVLLFVAAHWVVRIIRAHHGRGTRETSPAASTPAVNPR
jgi:uncharacterized membrane protein YdjX (TVP38/TMEM64 family)